MRRPDELTGDEAATVRELWACWPHGLLMEPDRDHAPLAALVEDGYLEATDHAEHGTEYRLHPSWGERLDRLTVQFADTASQN